MVGKKNNNEFDAKYEAILSRIAKNVLRLREKHNLTQEDMLEFGLERRWYQRIESGKHSPSLPTLYRLAEIFNVDISEFFKK